MQHLDIVPDVITPSAAIRACEKGQQCQPALYFLRAIQYYNIVLDVITHSAALSACERAGNTSRPCISYERCSTMTSCRT